MSETIALFGATGGTGKKFLKLALESGNFKVQALVRDKSKVDEETQKNENLTLFEGDFSKDKQAVTDTLKGAKYIVSMAGAPAGKPATEYPTDLMLNFYKTVTEIVKEFNDDAKPKVFLYQAGCFSPLPDKPLSTVASVLKTVMVDWVQRAGPIANDNTAVIQYIYDHKGELPFATIVSRPPALTDKPGSQAEVKADHHSPTNFAITFNDLAAWSLKAIQDETLYGTFPFLVPVDKQHLKGTTDATDKVANPVTQPMEKGGQAMARGAAHVDKAVDPAQNAANSALQKIQDFTKPMRDQIDKVLK